MFQDRTIDVAKRPKLGLGRPEQFPPPLGRLAGDPQCLFRRVSVSYRLAERLTVGVRTRIRGHRPAFRR
jgi:hypothetical protein